MEVVEFLVQMDDEDLWGHCQVQFALLFFSYAMLRTMAVVEFIHNMNAQFNRQRETPTQYWGLHRNTNTHTHTHTHSDLT